MAKSSAMSGAKDATVFGQRHTGSKLLAKLKFWKLSDLLISIITVVDIILSNVSLQKISDNIKSIHEFSDVLSVDLSKTMDEVLIHPSLCSSFANSQLNNISDVSSSRLGEAVNSLKQEKERRLRKLQDLASILIELWNTLDTPADERERFDLFTALISIKVDEVTA
ncbi:hypothetical protein Sjap_018023 [Stephania japonica]|uniref:Uncharacterized protein n=1 Tax=Stephania japonica TaxID=461633 RepID=A0AAP0I780_9MAGN